MKKSIFLIFAAILCAMSVSAKTIYLKPNSNWAGNSPRNAAYFFGNGETWVGMTDADGDGVYECEAPDGYPSVIFCSMNKNTTGLGWGDRWNQTADLTLPTDGKNLCTLANGWDNISGTWSTYTPPTEIVIPDRYLTGTLAGGWNANDIKMTYDETNEIYTHTFTSVAADTEHKLKVTDGTWSNSWGGNNVSPAIDGVTADGAGNAVFTLSTGGDVTVTFDGTNIQLTTTGEIKVAIPDRYIAGIGGWSETQVKMTYNEESKLHEHTFASLAAGDYEFKITDGTWTNSWGKDGQNYPFNLPAAGDVTIKYNWKDNSIELILPEVTEPEPDPTPDPEPVADVTIYFVNTKSWPSVNAYVWGTGDPYKTWPGEAMTLTGDKAHGYDVYSYTFPAEYTNCIFNGNGQTDNLTVNAGQYFDIASKTWYETLAEVPNPTPAVIETVYFINTGNWEKVYAYAWSSSNNGWPGTELTANGEKIGEFDIYPFEAEQDQWANIIFNNNSGTQTGDLTWKAGKYYMYSTGTWYDTKEDAEAALAGPATIVLHGNFVNPNWADTEKLTISDDQKTATITVLIEKGTYEFGVKQNGEWVANGKAFTKDNNEHEIVAGSGNLTLAADITGNYTFTWTYETNILSVTYPTEEVVVEKHYYVVGSFNGWNTADAAYEMALDGDVYKKEVTFAVNDEFKVCDGTWNASWGKGNLGGKSYNELEELEGGNLKMKEAKTFTIIFKPSENLITFDGLTETAPAVISYVLMGVNGDWDNGIALTQNPDNADEYILENQVIIKATDAVKVVTLTDGTATAWCGNVDTWSNATYTADGDGNIVLEDGIYTFYFKKNDNLIYINQTGYARNVTNTWGTICLPYASSSFTGATFYEVSSLNPAEGLWLDQLAAGTQLVAGKPYIFQATATEITVTYTGEAATTPQAGANGLTGTFTDIAAAAGSVLVGNYIIAQNAVHVATASNDLPAYRAYIANTVPTTEQPQLPGRRRVCMGENATTGLDQIVAPAGQAVKAIENGQLIIIRDGVKYNVQGQKL